MCLNSVRSARFAVAICASVLMGSFLPEAGAQALVDSFPNGFSAGLGWTGDLAAFNGENGRLVLREGRTPPQPDAQVWLAAPTRDSACWELEVDQRFSASASNRVRWWLAADRPLSDAGVRGFYLQLGGISGNLDAIELVSEPGSGPEVFAAGTAGIAAADPLTLKLEVCAQPDLTWTWTARDLSGATIDGASGVAPQELRGEFSGFDVAFTSTRSGLLSFDNFRIAPLSRDTTPPSLVLAKAEGPQVVILVASEALDARNGDPSRFSVGGQAPSAAAVNGDTVRLTLAQNLPSGTAVPVLVDGFIDLAGNTSAALTTTVTFVAPRQIARYELLISEIMADPTPVVGLPDAEYVEVYNASATAVDLSSVQLADGRVSVSFPAVTLAPGEYRAFARDPLGDARLTAMSGLPTLTNSGGTLRLLAAGGGVIDEVTYDDAYYRSGTTDGGYSLERRDLEQPCLLGAENFRSSSALAGGTPSAPNSAGEAFTAPDLGITGLTLNSPSSLIVTTNRILADASTAFRFNDGRAFSVQESDALGSYEITLAEPLVAGTVIFLGLTDRAGSCIPGEGRVRNDLSVGLPEANRAGDWALNEIMYDPLSGQGRWVELANVSDRLLTLGNLVLARTNAAGEVLARFTVEREVLVPAGALLVLADDPVTLTQQYPNLQAGRVVEASVPTLGSEDCLTLFDPVSEEVYFQVCYSEEWHNQAYASTDGVSLERISLSRDAQDESNWTSAASTVGFGTPTATNSQVEFLFTEGNAPFSLQGQRISPDGDGFEDLLGVRYQLDESGALGRFSIVDLRGYVIFEPDEDISLGNNGVWTWDGVDDDGNVVGLGTYVVRIEYWSPDSPARRSFLSFSVLEQL